MNIKNKKVKVKPIMTIAMWIWTALLHLLCEDLEIYFHAPLYTFKV
jgi:hypothetical protein